MCGVIGECDLVSGRHVCDLYFFFLMIRRPPRSTLDRSSAASDVYKRQMSDWRWSDPFNGGVMSADGHPHRMEAAIQRRDGSLSLIHISEPTRPY